MAISVEATGFQPITPDGQQWSYRSAVLLIITLTVCTVFVVRGIRVGEFSYNVDETQHAATGLFFASLIRDHPLTHPVQYTYRYYAQYPALSGVIHWPPLFYVAEGLFFLSLGPSVTAARLAILSFALVGLTFWFLLVRELLNEWAAALATVLLGVLPSVLLFEKTVMLEVPSLALCIAATFFWMRYLRFGRKWDVYLFAVVAAAALLTKQNAIYLVPFCLISGMLRSGWRFFFRAAVLRCAALCAILIGPYYALVYFVHWRTIAMDLTQRPPSLGSALLFYWRALPTQLGWVILVLAILGALTRLGWDRSFGPVLMLSWIAAVYLTFTAIGHKEWRYVIYWVPPFLYLAVGGVTYLFRRPVTRPLGVVSALALLVSTLLPAWSFRRPYVSGYAVAARQIVRKEKSGIILYDGYLPGNFIFFIRANDPSRRFVVLRKALYAYRIKASLGSDVLVHTTKGLEDLIERDGVHFVVVTQGNPLHFNVQRLLRILLTTPQFRLLGMFPIRGTDMPGHMHTLNLAVYENLCWAPPTAKFLRIKMLTLNHDIVVPMSYFRAAAGLGERTDGMHRNVPRGCRRWLASGRDDIAGARGKGR